jgi:hypothetical protein
LITCFFRPDVVSFDHGARLEQAGCAVSHLGTFGHVWAQKGTKRHNWAQLGSFGMIWAVLGRNGKIWIDGRLIFGASQPLRCLFPASSYAFTMELPAGWYWLLLQFAGENDRNGRKFVGR